MTTYHVSIQTNTDSITIGNYNNKKEAMKQAAYYRTGGLAWRNEFSQHDNAHIEVYNESKQDSIYCKPIFKNCLKK
jgi:hypothetical protein